MKPRRINNKLSLNKNTVSNLNDFQMESLKGGILPTLDALCDTRDVNCTRLTCEPLFCQNTGLCDDTTVW